MYIFFSAQSKKGCQVANGKPPCGASPGEDWPYYWRSSNGWACCCTFKQSVSKKRFPCTDRDIIVMQIRSAENKAQVKWLTAKCYPYFIHNCSLETIKNANIAFFLVSSFWGEEWYLEKCGSRKIFGPIWNLGTRFWWVSSLVFGWFLRLASPNFCYCCCCCCCILPTGLGVADLSFFLSV